MKRSTDRKRLFRRSDCLLNVLSSMRRAQKGCLELRWRNVTCIVEHRPEKTAEGLRIGSCGGIPVCNRPGGEEPGEHGAHAVVANGHARIVGCGSNPLPQSSTYLIQARVDHFPVITQIAERGQPCGHGQRVPG